jgi:hypothetical protein
MFSLHMPVCRSLPDWVAVAKLPRLRGFFGFGGSRARSRDRVYKTPRAKKRASHPLSLLPISSSPSFTGLRPLVIPLAPIMKVSTSSTLLAFATIVYACGGDPDTYFANLHHRNVAHKRGSATPTNPPVPPLSSITFGMPTQSTMPVTATYDMGATPPGGGPPLPTPCKQSGTTCLQIALTYDCSCFYAK